MAIGFPSNPSINQIYIAPNDVIYTFDGVKWKGYSLSSGFLNARVVTHADSTTITVDTDTTDIADMTNTQISGTIIINSPVGTPIDGQRFMIRLKSTNIQTFSWNSIFVGSADISLPTASSGSSYTDYIGFIYNSTSSKWHIVAKSFGY